MGGNQPHSEMFKSKIIDIGWGKNSARQKRANLIFTRIYPFLKNTGNVIDIGCGDGFVSHFLQKKGKKVTSVDIADKSVIPNLKVIVYDGKTLPFPSRKFDTALLLTVLHHTPDPKIVFNEATRVASRILIIEDIYTNIFQKIFNVFFDSWQNKPLKFFWNSYKSDGEWKKFFEDKGLKVIATEYFQDIPYLHGLYALKKAP